jgi:hypothetical protein
MLERKVYGRNMKGKLEVLSNSLSTVVAFPILATETFLRGRVILHDIHETSHYAQILIIMQYFLCCHILLSSLLLFIILFHFY